MNNIKFNNLIQKIKDKNKELSIIEYFSCIDLSTEYKISDIPLFLPDNNYDDNTLKKYKIYKNITNELFYNPGIIGNLFNVECSYNWVFGYIFINQYIFLFNDSIKSLHIGFGNGDFIKGMEYYIKTKQKHLKNTWVGIDKNYSNDTKKNDNIIHGIFCDDVLLYTNIKHIKILIENKFNKVNFIMNNIYPKDKKNKLLISIAIISLDNLVSNGILLTKILNPEKWTTEFINYIMLFCILFKNVEIFRYPYHNKNYVTYAYYLLCKNKKKIINESKIIKRMLTFLKDEENKRLIFNQNIIDDENISSLKKRILEIRQIYIDSSNPQNELMEIINKLDII